MATLELNKIAAAILLAGIIGLSSSIISKTLFEQKELEKTVYLSDLAPSAEGGTPSSGGTPEEIKPIAPLLAAADLNKGQQVFKLCGACHTNDKGGPHRTGPNLWNVVGEKKGSREGFSYSPAMHEAGGTWDFESLNKYLANPKGFIPKNKMTFIGLKKESDRAAVIAYLRTMNDNPPPLPAAQ